MNTVKKCIALGIATLAFASMLVLGSDASLRAELFGPKHPAEQSAPATP